MDSLMNNEIVIFLLIVLVMATGGIIYLLVSPKKFHIKTIDIELNNFLNLLHDSSKQSHIEAKKSVNTFTSQLKNYEEQQSKTKDGLNNFVQHIIAEMQTMKEHIGAIQKLSLEKEEKIRRYEDGYDHTNIKKFTKGLFRILETIKEEKIKNNSEFLSEIEEDILNLLENNGIEKIDITIGNTFKEYSKVAKVSGTELTTDFEKNLTVKEVKKNGYQIEIDENNNKVLIPSEIIIYKLKTGEENV